MWACVPQEPEEEASLRAEELTQEKEQEPQGQRRASRVGGSGLGKPMSFGQLHFLWSKKFMQGSERKGGKKLGQDRAPNCDQLGLSHLGVKLSLPPFLPFFLFLPSFLPLSLPFSPPSFVFFTFSSAFRKPVPKITFPKITLEYAKTESVSSVKTRTLLIPHHFPRVRDWYVTLGRLSKNMH